jgi:hypothetical protein
MPDKNLNEFSRLHLVLHAGFEFLAHKPTAVQRFGLHSPATTLDKADVVPRLHVA